MHTVVVVDDEPELCGFVKELLEFEGYQVVGVSHPDEVKETIGEAQPALFLIDIMLPSMSGIELAEQLRKSGYDDVPMIGMSASKLMSHMAAESGVFDDAMNKPFEIDDLLARVQRHVEQNVGNRG